MTLREHARSAQADRRDAAVLGLFVLAWGLLVGPLLHLSEHAGLVERAGHAHLASPGASSQSPASLPLAGAAHHHPHSHQTPGGDASSHGRDSLEHWAVFFVLTLPALSPVFIALASRTRQLLAPPPVWLVARFAKAAPQGP